MWRRGIELKTNKSKATRDMPTQDELRAFLAIANEAASAGGAILRRYWGRLRHIQRKTSASDLVTEADTASEQAILEILLRECPTHKILAEESGWTEGSVEEYVWAVDPLDGTTNYTHQYPMVAVSIGLLYREQPIIGVVYNPILEERFSAAQGLGTTLNGEKIEVSQVDSLEQTLLSTGFAYDRLVNPDNNYPEFCRLTDVSQGVRRAGAAALDLAYVAAGRLDGYWEKGLHIWDIAAGVVLVTEAGGTVSEYDESPLELHSGRILATNGRIHVDLSGVLRDVRGHRRG